MDASAPGPKPGFHPSSLQIVEALLEHSPHPLVYLDRDFTIVRANRAFAEDWRKRPEELVGRRIFELYPDPELEAVFARARDTGEGAGRLEMPLALSFAAEREGTLWDWTLTPLKDDAGRAAGLVFSPREVTEKVAARRRIEESEERYRRLFSATSDGIWISCLDGVIREVNDAYCCMSGYTREELVGLPVSAVEAVESPAEVAERMQRLTRAGGHDRFESRHRRKDGALFDVDVTALYLDEESGRIAVCVRDITQRKREEEDLRRSEHDFRLLADAIPQLVWQADATGAMVFYNAWAYEYGGVRPGEVGGWDWTRFLHPDDVGPTLESWRRAIRSGERFVAEVRLRRADGEHRWHLSRGIPVRDGAGRTVLWIGTCTDIHDQKRAQEALRESESRLSLALEVSQLGLWDLDLRQRTAWRSPRHDEIFGYGSLLPTWTYEVFLGHVLPEDRAEVDRRFREAVDTGRDWECECRVRRQDGIIRWIWARGRGEYDEARRPTRMLGLVQDITARKEIEEALRESRKQYQDLIETNVDAVWETDAQGRYTYCSPQMETLRGVRPEELIGKTPFEEMPPDERERVLAIFRGMQQNPAPVGGLQTQAVLEGGRVATLETRAVPFFDDKGALLGFRGTTRDITEQQCLEQERARYLARIQEANEAKDLFFNTLSHELRTPLAAMLNAVEVLKKPESIRSQRIRSLGILERNVRHQTHLIEDLLDLSRIMRKKIEIEHDPLDLRDLVNEQVDAVEGAVRKGQLTLELEARPARVGVVGDAVRLGQVVSNLLTNAVKFTSPGGRIMVQVGVDGEEAVVRVSDNGVGMAPEVLPHIFEPFRQAETSLTRSKGGLGIGLAVARSLAELHGGTLEAHSEGLGRGSELTLRLPLHLGAEAADARAVEVGAEGQRRRVLVIEDNPDLRESLLILLEMMGHSVVSAADGTTGVELARRERPDVAFVDIGLPDMDGYAVARVMRSDPSLKDLRLVALTGYATPEHRERALVAGFNRHLAKPVETEELLQVLAGEGRRDGGPA